MPKNAKPPKKLKTRITQITMAVLYNLGRYEHVRYELSAEVGPGESAKAAFEEVRYILAVLKPLRTPDCLASYNEACKLEDAQRSEYQKANIDAWASEVGAWNTAKARRADAIKALDTLGGNSKFRDAKQDWENQDDTPF